MGYFDSHSHYNDEKFNEDRNEIISKVYLAGVSKTVCVGYNAKKSIEAYELSKKYEYIYSSAGISPNDLEDYTEKNLNIIKELAKLEKVVAVGEIGLDYYWNKENKEKQKELFIKQIEIANEVNKPIIIHTRDAAVDTIDILKKYEVIKKGIFHCCPLNQELVKEAVKLGYYISFSGNITFKNAKSAEVIKLVPLNKLLIETDSPYLTPEPYRGTRNNPENVKFVSKKIAEVLNKTDEEIENITYSNACKVYNIFQSNM